MMTSGAISLCDALEAVLRFDPDQTAARLRGDFDRLAGPAKDAVVLFGAGTAGRQALEGMLRAGSPPVALADNNSALWDTEIVGIPVLSPADAVVRYKDSAVFVVTIFQGAGARRQLREMGVRRIISLAPLYWKFADELLPLGSLSLAEPPCRAAADVRAAFQLLSDDASRLEFVRQLEWRANLESELLPPALPLAEMYFPRDLLAPRRDEVFVDCGAFDGDTLQAFLEFSGGDFRRYQALEPDPANHARFVAGLAQLRPEQRAKVDVRQAAVGARGGTVRFDAQGSLGSAVKTDGHTEVECLPLDAVCRDLPPTFIKFDVEGAEAAALQGAAGVIAEHAPVLAICVYHKPEDLWSLPLAVHRLRPDYRYFLRRYVEDCWEMVCYAVPATRLRSLPATVNS